MRTVYAVAIRGHHSKGVTTMPEYQAINGTSYHKETLPEVIAVLERVMASGERVRLFFGDTKTGCGWNEEFDVAGLLGRSMGPVKVPLLINNSRSMGGGAIMDHHIVGIVGRPGQWLYRHRSLDLGEWSLLPSTLPEDYHTDAFRDGELIARFRKPGQGLRYVEFMTGGRLSK